MQLLLALALVIIGLYLACVNIAHAIKNIQPRQSIIQKRTEELSKYNNKREFNNSAYEEPRLATQEELYQEGWIARDVMVDGKECLEKQGVIIWCQPE